MSQGKKEGECGYEDDNGTSSRQPVEVGQFVEMSICCCKGNDGAILKDQTTPDCSRGIGENELYYNCEQIKKDVKAEEVDIDQVCSCACYSVEFKFHDPSEYPVIKSEAGGDKCYLAGKPQSAPCYVGGFGGGANSNQPGCPGDTACSMDITDCRCMDAEGEEGPPPSPEHADGWYICAEYVSESILTCACCPGLPDLPGGGAGMITAGGCTSGYKIRAFITVKDKSSARQNPRVPDKCPSC